MFGEIVELVSVVIGFYLIIAYVVSLTVTVIWKDDIKTDYNGAVIGRLLMAWLWPVCVPIGILVVCVQALAHYPYRLIKWSHRVVMGEEHIDWMAGVRRFWGKYWSIRAALSNEK